MWYTVTYCNIVYQGSHGEAWVATPVDLRRLSGSGAPSLGTGLTSQSLSFTPRPAVAGLVPFANMRLSELPARVQLLHNF